jgi:hypothetical protein
MWVKQPWPIASGAAVVSLNMIHIAPWDAGSGCANTIDSAEVRRALREFAILRHLALIAIAVVWVGRGKCGRCEASWPGLSPVIHVFYAFNRRPEGYQNGKALFLEVFAAGEANVKLVIETAPRGWPGQARTSPAMTVEAPRRSRNEVIQQVSL